MLEIKLLILLLITVYLFRIALGQAYVRSFFLVAAGMVLGFGVQLLLGRELNAYTSNVRVYLDGVSLAVIMTWGIGLSAIYSVHMNLVRRFQLRPNLILHTLVSIALIILIEFLGSNLLLMKLHNYQVKYRSIFPAFNSMHAPLWLYAYYYLVSALFYFSLKWLRLERIFWRDEQPAGGPVFDKKAELE
jgi:hypothetical protein